MRAPDREKPVFYHRHRWPVRVMHWINVLAFFLLLMSGLQIFNAHPALNWGRSSYDGKPPLLVGLTLFMIASLGCALSGSVEALTGWRVVQAMGGAAGIVIPRAVIRDHYETHEAARAMAPRPRS